MAGLIMLGALVVLGIFIATKSFKVVGQAEVMVVERLGRFHRLARSGLNVLIPFVELPRTIDVRYFESDVTGLIGTHGANRFARAGAQLSEPARDHQGQCHDRH
jgi:regulator of protease activity HflC (stomatin/prohibitin superfamily)